MKAIELHTTTDMLGQLKVEYNINQPKKNVRVLILVDDEYPNLESDDVWLSNAANSTAFSFLNEPVEDVYSLNDGERIDSKSDCTTFHNQKKIGSFES
jgi:hypothetical protein